MKYDIKAKQVDGFASKLEWHFSNFLNDLEIEFIYEYKTFKTKIGNYTPDFYLYNSDIFIEIKPFIPKEKSYLSLLQTFVKENKKSLIIITPDQSLTFGCVKGIHYDGSNYEDFYTLNPNEEKNWPQYGGGTLSYNGETYVICECKECTGKTLPYFHWIQPATEWATCPKCENDDKPYHTKYVRWDSFKEYWDCLDQNKRDRRF